MGYYLRVLAKSSTGVSVRILQQRLEKDRISAILEGDSPESSMWTRLLLRHPDGPAIADIERNQVRPGSLGSEELNELSEEIAECKPETAARWLRDFLRSVKAIYAFQVLGGAEKGQGWDAIYSIEGELWRSLGGIFQSDGEGFSNEDGYHILWQFDSDVRRSWKMAVLGPDHHWTAFEMDLGNQDQRAAFLAGKVPAGVKAF